MAAHSQIGASSMHRWEPCPGSVALCADIPSKSSSYAEEGTFAHEVASHYLERGKWLEAPKEMMEAVMVYTDEVTRLAGSHDAAALIEHRFDLGAVRPEYAGCFGTADCVIYRPSLKLLQVIDYKHGAGVPVEVKDNEQLLYYALGALETLKVPCEKVELIIIQPRCEHPDGPVRRWTVDALELLDFADRLIKAAEATRAPDAPLNPGDHCRWCPAAGTCPALHNQAVVAAKEEFSPALSYSPEKLAATLEMLPRVEAWAKSVREFAYAEAQHGRNPPGWKLVQKRASRRWKLSDTETATAIEMLTDIDSTHLWESTLKSPAQVEKLLGKVGASALAELVVKESSGYALAPESDPREAAKLDAKSEFEVVITNA